MVVMTAYQAPVIWEAPSITQPFSWLSLPIQTVFESGLRLEASVYATDAQKSKQLVEQCKYGAIPLADLTDKCSYPGRFKRSYVSKQCGKKLFLPSQLNELNPKATKFLSVKKISELDILRVKENTLLITRSGTIGNCTIASKTLVDGVFSDDVIRLTPKQVYNLGYIYIYLKSESGRAILQSANYGAVIQHIEPAHLLNLPIPDAPAIIKSHIHHTITESFRLRDESNVLIEQAQAKLQAALKLPAVEELNPPANGENGLRSFSVKVSDLNRRLEANYHNPLAEAITQHLHKHADQVLALGNNKITHKILLAGRFKRVYVVEKQGIPFLGGKEILGLDPRGEKYLSLKHHGKRIADQLTLDENMILITCSGTIGKVNIVPKHWQGWAGSQHILRVIPASAEWAGYLYAWLSSEWALPLIRRHTYGAVVFEIDQYQLAEVPVPMLSHITLMQEINTLVLRANELRFVAFTKEQEALRLFNEKVLGLPSTSTLTKVSTIPTDDLIGRRIEMLLGIDGVDRLNKFKGYKAGWNFGDGFPLSPKSLSTMEYFITYSFNFQTEPSIFMNNEGHLLLGWEDLSGKKIELEFQDDSIGYFIESLDEEDEILLDSKHIELLVNKIGKI